MLEKRKESILKTMREFFVKEFQNLNPIEQDMLKKCIQIVKHSENKETLDASYGIFYLLVENRN